jgi:predicted metal-dependent hydrolase
MQLPQLPFEVRLTRHPRSRRISVRIHPLKRCVILNVPKRGSIERGIEFLHKKRPWIEEQLARHASEELAHVYNGMELGLFGEPVTLCHEPGRRGANLLEGKLLLGGGEAFLPRRLREFLIKHAKATFAEQVAGKLQNHPEFEGRRAVVAVREMASRWGSCTRRGRVCFNWRLVFAPVFVADYLVCHELAHLLHANHGPRFWAQVEKMCPRMSEARQWLRRHGGSVYRLKLD